MQQKILSWQGSLEAGFVAPQIKDGTPLPDAIGIVSHAVTEHLLHSPAVREFFERTPKGPGTRCPDSPVDELVQYAAAQSGKVDLDGTHMSLAVAEDITRPRLAFERNALWEAIESTDATAREISLIDYGNELAACMDDFYLTWFRQVAIPFREAAKETQQALLADLADYDYTVPVMDGDKRVARLTWEQAFPNEIKNITHVLRAMQHRAVNKPLAAYFYTLRAAFLCKNPAHLENAWAAVDRAWVLIPPTERIVPVHGMENGYDHPACVSPEFRLEVRTDDGKEVIPFFVHMTLPAAEMLHIGETSRAFLERKLANFDVGIFQRAIESGACLNFSYSGQSVPNRQDIPGGKVFLVKPNDNIGVENARKELRQHCTPETAALLIPLVTDKTRLLPLLGHECFHPVACTPETDAALGSDRSTIDESKATLGGLFVANLLAASDDERLALVANMLAYIFRVLHASDRGDQTMAHYVADAKIAAGTLFESGAAVLTEQGIAVRKEAYREWIAGIKHILMQMIRAYDAHDRGMVKAIQEVYCYTSDQSFLGRLIAWIDRPHA